MIQTVRYIQTQTIDIEFIDPVFYTFHQVINDCRILKI